MSGPRWVDVETPAVRLRALTWEPDGGVAAPIALCLHGFPDTAYGFRKLAPLLVSRGWRVVAPFMRGYVPSSVPVDRSYHIGALMDDALRVRDACEPTDRDIVIGHDWGALTATGLAAMPFWRDRVSMAALGIAALACAILGGYVFAGYPDLPNVVELSFPELGGIVRVGDKGELLRIAYLGAGILAFNAVAGVLLHAKERAAGLWLMAASGLLQCVLMGAAILAYSRA